MDLIKDTTIPRKDVVKHLEEIIAGKKILYRRYLGERMRPSEKAMTMAAVVEEIRALYVALAAVKSHIREDFKIQL
jgi:hypothetical protein